MSDAPPTTVTAADLAQQQQQRQQGDQDPSVKKAGEEAAEEQPKGTERRDKDSDSDRSDNEDEEQYNANPDDQGDLIAVHVPTTQVVDKPEKHTVYFIRVTTTNNSYEVVRRYREFAKLNEQLNTKIFLPGKKLFGNLDSKYVEYRRRALEQYLQTIIKYDENIINNPALRQFLELDTYDHNITEEFQRPSTEKAMDLNKPLKTGFLSKQGGSVKTWHRRYFVLTRDGVYLHYYKNPTTKKPQGTIVLKNAIQCQVCLPIQVHNAPYEWLFEIVTPERTFVCAADAEHVRDAWVNILKPIIADKETFLKVYKNEDDSISVHSRPKKMPGRISRVFQNNDDSSSRSSSFSNSSHEGSDRTDTNSESVNSVDREKPKSALLEVPTMSSSLSTSDLPITIPMENASVDDDHPSSHTNSPTTLSDQSDTDENAPPKAISEQQGKKAFRQSYVEVQSPNYYSEKQSEAPQPESQPELATAKEDDLVKCEKKVASSTQQHQTPAGNVGSIFLSMELRKKLLLVNVIRARNLSEICNSFIKLYLLPLSGGKDDRRKTLVFENDRNPEFEQTFSFDIDDVESLKGRALRLIVHKYIGFRKSIPLGGYEILLSDYLDAPNKQSYHDPNWHPLSQDIATLPIPVFKTITPKEATNVPATASPEKESWTKTLRSKRSPLASLTSFSSSNVYGEILVDCKYEVGKQELNVTIIEGKDVHIENLSDSFYVKTYLTPDVTKKTKKKGNIYPASQSPKFQENFKFTLSKEAVGVKQLEVSIWKESDGRHSHLYNAIINFSDMEKNADWSFTRWFKLKKARKMSFGSKMMMFDTNKSSVANSDSRADETSAKETDGDGRDEI